MAEAEYGRRVAETRARMEEAGLDALLVASQYNRRYLTGFSHADGDITESSGWALVTRDALNLITGTFFLTSLEHEIVPSGAILLSTDEAPAHIVLAAALERAGVRRLGFEKDWLSYGRYERIRAAIAQTVDLVPGADIVERVRMRKDDAEIAVMRRAASIADQAFARLVTEIRGGMTERQIAARLDALMVSMGASDVSFPTIVACGPGAALPHAVPTDREIQPGEPLLLDFGCILEGYCSDTTKTIVLGEPSAKLVEIYGVVRAAQDAAESALTAGARRGRDVDGAARAVIANAGYGGQFIHSTGHGVGMAVHELPYVASPRGSDPETEAALAQVEGFGARTVVTVEPGVYIAGWGGVRLEDMALTTDDGADLMTARNPERILVVGGGE